jgi:hypothetical protein
MTASMQTREKILAAALAGIVAVWFGAPWFDSTFLQPLRDAENKLEDARQALQTQEDRAVAIIQAEGRLKRWQSMSLPRDPLVAQRVYQAWLTDLTEASGWPNVKVSSSRGQTKGNTYVTIPVTLDATITWEQLGRFLSLVQEAHILHRVVKVDVNYRGTGEQRPLDVKLQLEGVAMAEGPAINQLSAEGSLAAPLKLDATQMTVTGRSEFPSSTPFFVRLGAELIKVTAIGENGWTIERGQWSTSPRSHEAGDKVQLFPTGPELRDVPTLLAKFVSSEFFVKPQPARTYNPRLTASTPPQAYFNQPWTHSVKLEGWNPEWDDPVFVLQGDVPENLVIDQTSGQLQWYPVPAASPQQYEVEVAAMSIWDEEPKAVQKLTLKAMRANLPPILRVPDVLPVYFGQPAEFNLAAENPPDERDRLTYRLEGNLPEGATFDTRTGRFAWNPPIDGAPGEVTLTLTVTDDGVPPASVSKQLRLTLADDNARYTRLEGIWSLNGQPEAWFRDLTVNKQQKAKLGNSISYADVQGTIAEIGRDFVVISRGTERFRLKTGQTLRQLEKLPPLPVSTADVPVETPLDTPVPTAPASGMSAQPSPPTPATPEAIPDQPAPAPAAGNSPADAAAENEAADPPGTAPVNNPGSTTASPTTEAPVQPQ